MKIRLSSKRLNSGKCQVRFHVSGQMGEKWYGYALTEPSETLREVVNRIENRFYNCQDKVALHQKGLYHLNDGRNFMNDLMIFRDA